MNINFENMCTWEVEKAQYLVRIAILHNFPIKDAVVDVNKYSGNVYYYHEDLEFSLFMPIQCDLKLDDIYVLYTFFEDGEEFEKKFSDFDYHENMLDQIVQWVYSIYKSKTNE